MYMLVKPKVNHIEFVETLMIDLQLWQARHAATHSSKHQACYRCSHSYQTANLERDEEIVLPVEVNCGVSLTVTVILKTSKCLKFA